MVSWGASIKSMINYIVINEYLQFFVLYVYT